MTLSDIGSWPVKKIFFVLLAASALAHFAFFGHPNQTVFDEVHFGKFISGYYTHEYFFDIHPPLGKLLIAGFGKIFDFHPEYSFTQIGDKFPDSAYMLLRFLPALAGTLLAPVIFLLALEFGLSRMASAFAAACVILENAILVQSRLILLDAFLLLFGFAALLAYFRYQRTGRYRWLTAFSILAGMSFSVKWTGIGFLGLAGLAMFIHFIRARDWGKFVINTMIFFVIIPGFLYYSVFAIHFALLTKSGTGDAFMTAQFQKTLAGNGHAADDLPAISGLTKFVQLNAEMYLSNQRLNATHPYSSQWYTWPLMMRPIYYWVDAGTGDIYSRIYFLGNPVIWWSSTLAILFLITHFLLARRLPERTAGLLIAAYFFNLLPFIGVKRIMFLYHYMPALIFAIIVMAYCIEKFHSAPKRAYATLLVAGLVMFIFIAPLTYGLRLTDKQYHWRTWLQTWI